MFKNGLRAYFLFLEDNRFCVIEKNNYINKQNLLDLTFDRLYNLGYDSIFITLKYKIKY